MPDKAAVAAPWWAANGPEPTSKPANVYLKKKKITNSEPTSIIQHQLTENGFF